MRTRLRKRRTGLLLLDLMSKKGIGAGIHQKYHIGDASGSLELYGLHDNNINQDTLTGRLVHSEQWARFI